MRFKTLEIKNIASIEYATINFEDPILENESLFLIYGETGSGKTTILDSICLALYKTTPRIKQSKGDKYLDDDLRTGKDATEISITDIRQYLRRGSNEGFVELTFLGNDSKDYTARLEFGKTKNGTLKNVEWSIASEQDKYEKDNEIKATILRAVGLDYEQFCRTTMLAQGEFTKFLKSEIKDKTIILEKVTGTEIYTRIGSEIYYRAKAKEDEINGLKKELEYLTVLSQDELDSLVEERNRLISEIGQLDTQKVEFGNQKKWLEQKAELDESVKDNKQKLDTNNNFKQGSQYIDSKKLVNDFRNSETARQSLARIEELTIEQQTNQRKREKYYDSYMRLTEGDLYRAGEIAEKKRQYAEIESFTARQSVNAVMFENSQAIIAQLQNFIKENNEAISTQKNAEEKENELPVLESKGRELNDRLEQLVAQKKQLQSLIDGKQKEYDSIGYANLQTRQIAINNAITSIDAYEESKRKYADSQASIGKLKNDISANKKRQLLLSEQLEIATKATKDSEELYNSMKLSVGDYAKSLRAELRVGDKCPVCGQKIVDLESDESLENALRPLLDDLDSKKKNAEDIDKENNSVVTEIKAQEMQLQKSEQDELQCKSSLDKCQKAFESACSALNFDIDDNPLSLKEKCQKLKSEFEQRINDGNVLLDAIKSLNADKDNVVNEAEKQSRLLSENNEKTGKFKAEINNLKENCRQSRQKANDALNSVSSKITYAGWSDNIESTIGRLQAEAKEYADKCRCKIELASQIQNEESAIRQSADVRKEVEEMFADWKPGTVPAHMDKLDYNWTFIFSEGSKLFTCINQSNEQKNKEIQNVNAFLEKTGISYGRLTELAQMDDTQIANAESYVTQIDNAIVEASGALKLSNDLLEKHLKLKPKIEKDYTEIASCIAECETRISDSNKRIGEIDNKLKTNSENFRLRADKDKIIQKLEEDFKNWDNLDNLFGDKEGKKFRTIAQSFILKELLAKANYYLSQLSNRYVLDCQNNSLVILVRDMYFGGKMRPVDLMSGGESFVVSLALALGLSNLNSNGFTTDMLFIDEGFGTLDSNTLETVMNTLEHLREIGNRKVGIISHVDALYERIPTKICVERTGNNTGSISLVRD